MSKGSKPRPFSVSNEEYANRWDAIFGRDVKKDKDELLGNRTTGDSLGRGKGNSAEQHPSSPSNQDSGGA